MATSKRRAAMDLRGDDEADLVFITPAIYQSVCWVWVLLKEGSVRLTIFTVVFFCELLACQRGVLMLACVLIQTWRDYVVERICVNCVTQASTLYVLLAREDLLPSIVLVKLHRQALRCTSKPSFASQARGRKLFMCPGERAISLHRVSVRQVSWYP